MTISEFEFDVAFSFLGRDENIAVQLNDLVKGRLKTFLYSEQQAILAGRDGEEKFNHVFGTAARVVVVLYRAGWGDSGFTLIESTAIRNRAFVRGYGFTMFIPLDQSPAVPEWLPKTQLWYGLGRHGFDGAATVIEAKVSEAGGEPREESPEDMAAAIIRDREFASKRGELLDGAAGVNAAWAAFDELQKELERICGASSDLIKSERSTEAITIRCGRRRVTFSLEFQFRNSLKDCALHVRSEQTRRYAHEDPDDPDTSAYSFDIGPNFVHGWRLIRDNYTGMILTLYTTEPPFVTTKELADSEAKKLLKRLR